MNDSVNEKSVQATFIDTKEIGIQVKDYAPFLIVQESPVKTEDKGV